MNREKKWKHLRKLWWLWSKEVEDHPFFVLFSIYIPVLAYEGLSKGLWVVMVVAFAIGLVVSFATSMLLKWLIKEDRGREIKNAMDYRRPSAHTLIATTLFVVASLLDHVLFFPLVVTTIMTGYSRVWIGAHEWRDVVEGAISGMILGIFLYIVIV